LPSYDKYSIIVDDALKPVESVRFRGLKLDNNLDWHAHIIFVINKL